MPVVHPAERPLKRRRGRGWALAARRPPTRAPRARRQCLLEDDASRNSVTKAVGRRADALEMTAAQPPLPVLVDRRQPADACNRFGFSEEWILRILRDVFEYTRAAHVCVRSIAVR